MFGIIAELESIEAKIGQACSFLENLSKKYFNAAEPEVIEIASEYNFISGTIDVSWNMLEEQRRMLIATSNNLHNAYLEMKKAVGILELAPKDNASNDGSRT